MAEYAAKLARYAKPRDRRAERVEHALFFVMRQSALAVGRGSSTTPHASARSAGSGVVSLEQAFRYAVALPASSAMRAPPLAHIDAAQGAFAPPSKNSRGFRRAGKRAAESVFKQMRSAFPCPIAHWGYITPESCGTMNTPARPTRATKDPVASLMPRQYGHSTIQTELLRSFIAISEHGSFTKAAEELNLTQPAISAQMKRLQQMLGGHLLVKKGQGIGLTELGSIVESYARRVLTLNDQIIAIAGRVPKGETLYIGIQSIFVRSVLSEVVRKLPGANKGSYRFISGNANFLAENLRSGYLDLVFMLVQSESRRGLVADWLEKMVWVHARHFVVPEDAPIPYLSRHEGYMDRKVLDLFDESNVPYRIAFSAVDLWNLAAAAEAGVGVLATLDRVKSDLSRSLVVAKEKILPKLPELRAGVFFKEGFDAGRNQAIVQAFVSAVRPRSANKNSQLRSGG